MTLSVLSNVSFAANDLLVFGEVGEELTELERADSISGKTTITMIASLDFSHPKDTPVYRTVWNFVEIEGRSTSAGTFATITQSPIQWDKRDTIYYHSDGTSTWQYRFRFWNSQTNTYSEYSPTVSGSGFTRQQVGFMLTRVRQKTKDYDARVADDVEIIGWFNDAQDIIFGRNPKYWFLYVDPYKGSNGIAATASTDVYSLATYTTLGNVDSIRYRYNSGSTNQLYQLLHKPTVEFDSFVRDLNRGTDDWPSIYKLLPADSSSSKGYFQIDPVIKSSNVGTFFPNYYEKMADLDTVDDETQVPLPALLENFAIGQIERIRGNETKAQLYENLFWGPPDKRQQLDKIQGLVLLDEMDRAQRNPQGQPKQLWRFLGRKPLDRLYNRQTMDRDTLVTDYW